jgi:hypothetical protein
MQLTKNIGMLLEVEELRDAEREAVDMATTLNKQQSATRSSPVPRALRARIEPLLLENYAYMDSPVFKERSIEAQLFTENPEPALPMTAWYQPTRDDPENATPSTPQLMSAKEERVMFLRFNYCKSRLQRLQKKIQKDGLTRQLAEEFLDWHRRFEHYREYLTRTNLALVLAMAKRTRLGDLDFAEFF